MPIKLRPVSRQATPVLPAPMNGSSTVQPGGVTSSSSLSRATGLAVRCGLALSTQCAKQPGRQRSCAALNFPLLTKSTNSHCCLNRPFWGRAQHLSHASTPPHVHRGVGELTQELNAIPLSQIYIRHYRATCWICSGHGVASPPPSQGAPDWAGRSRRACR